jgi:hypothetical protein
MNITIEIKYNWFLYLVLILLSLLTALFFWIPFEEISDIKLRLFFCGISLCFFITLTLLFMIKSTKDISLKAIEAVIGLNKCREEQIKREKEDSKCDVAKIENRLHDLMCEFVSNLIKNERS